MGGEYSSVVTSLKGKCSFCKTKVCVLKMERHSHARELLIFLFFFSVGHVFCVEVVPVETGGTCTFKSSASGTPQTILWKFNKMKVVEYENNEFTWYRFESRADLDIQTGDFTLKQLSKEDSGHYESEIQVDGKLQYSNHEIKVLDAVPVPEVTCHANCTVATLLCSVGSSVQAELIWSGPNGFEETGERISVSPKEQSVYICTAQNEVSKKSTEFSQQKCLTGHVFCAEVVPVETGGTYTFKSSTSGTPESILWKFNKMKVVEYENNEVSWYRFEGRANLNIQTGDFTLKQLSKEDSGHYESEIQVDGKLQYSNHEIKVLGHVFCAEVVPVETGGTCTFKSSASGTPQTILWKFNKMKVVEYENNEFTWYRFESRADLDIQTGDFTLKQLSKEDSGHYESEIQVDGKLQYSNHEIKVLGK
ncbi:uncharacterized protein LOC118801913 isoform X1 [Colossoma macropomum]|uniref:uncharacterized protein LOC118801913 isoform X1 n=1 Tax=Colossoma macropomum TaxID=42526 RepID=UPI001863D060|nr:uncharacterized protein LOC118801913 isoform X1 [Colossoma macropomum]